MSLSAIILGCGSNEIIEFIGKAFLNPGDDIIAEVAAARVTERGSRADDKASEAAMEDRKKAGYF